MPRRSNRSTSGKVPAPEHMAGSYYKIAFNMVFPGNRAVDRTQTWYLSRENINWNADEQKYVYTLGKYNYLAEEIEAVATAEARVNAANKRKVNDANKRHAHSLCT